MLFNSYLITTFIIVACCLYILSKKFNTNLYMKICMLFFLNLIVLSILINKKFLVLLIIGVTFAYFIAKYLFGRKMLYKNLLLFFSVMGMVLLLAITKYDWLQNLIGTIGLNQLATKIETIEAIGVSYIFFKLIHFLVDSYNNKIPNFNLLIFLNYIFFFPTYLAGPIDRYQNFYKWMNSNSLKKDSLLFWAGLYRIFSGTVKKFMFEPLVSVYAMDFTTVQLSNYNLINLFISLVAYSLYIYLNFSGYSDMAIGTGMLLGFKAPENFDNPYFAPNISDFWRRWHISLSTILREYIFLPTVRFITKRFNKAPRILVTIIGYFVTFSICGIWHGSTLNFLIWGLWHAVGLAINRVWRSTYINEKIGNIDNKAFKIAYTGLAIFITFSFVTFGWLFFNYSLDNIYSFLF